MPSDLRPDMGARIVDGKTIGLDIQQDVAREVRGLNERGVYPRLAVVIAGLRCLIRQQRVLYDSRDGIREELVAEHLYLQCSRKMIIELFFEYYSCKNGKPMGAKNFSWSAALYLDLKFN